MSTGETELLISAVQRRPSLWDSRCKMYHNRVAVDFDWMEVAEITRSTKELVKSRWKNLRDHFRKGFKKMQKTPDFIPQWIYHERLMFLKDVLQATAPEHSASNELQQTAYILGDTDDGEYQNSSESPLSPMEYNASDSRKSLSLKRKSTEPLDLEANYPEVGYVRESRREDENDDLNFFKSLLPFMKQLPPIKKLMVRSEIQGIMVRELSDLDRKMFKQETVYEERVTYD